MDLGKLEELGRKRVCKGCGAVFHTDEKGTALAQWSDHLVEHQPTAEQWSKAYEKLQEQKHRSVTGSL